jgi:hypothetical protein
VKSLARAPHINSHGGDHRTRIPTHPCCVRIDLHRELGMSLGPIRVRSMSEAG